MQELEKILKEIKEVLEENKVIELNGDCTVDKMYHRRCISMGFYKSYNTQSHK